MTHISIIDHPLYRDVYPRRAACQGLDGCPNRPVVAYSTDELPQQRLLCESCLIEVDRQDRQAHLR